jgi:osmoprotectant transport system permease protein
MTALNYQVDHQKRAPEAVAGDFLRERGLLRPDRQQGGLTIAIGSKLFTEQYILVEIFRLLIEGHTGLDVEIRPGLGGTKICYEALRSGEIDLYPEYTGTGFQVLLSPPDSVARAIFTDRSAVFQYVQNEMREQDDVQWLAPLGFNNTYALMTRQALAKERGWRRISDLGQREAGTRPPSQ